MLRKWLSKPVLNFLNRNPHFVVGNASAVALLPTCSGTMPLQTSSARKGIYRFSRCFHFFSSFQKMTKWMSRSLKEKENLIFISVPLNFCRGQHKEYWITPKREREHFAWFAWGFQTQIKFKCLTSIWQHCHILNKLSWMNNINPYLSHLSFSSIYILPDGLPVAICIQKP